MLKELLKKKNVTLRELEKSSGIAHATLFDLYSGKSDFNKCSIKNAIKIAKALNMSIEDLYIELTYVESIKEKKEIKKVDKALLHELTDILMFKMNEEEYETLLNEFNVLVKQMELFDEIEGIDNVPPMSFPFDVTNDFLREDIADTPLSVEEALANASIKQDNQIKLPKVVN